MVITAVQNHLNRRDYQGAVEAPKPIALIDSPDGYAALGAAIALYRDALLYDPDNELCRKRLSSLQSD